VIDQYVESASTYAGDIDGVILWILAIVGFWFLLAQAVFFGLIFKFMAKPGVKAQYISGEKAHEKRWVALPHYATLVFDVIIVVMAVKVWHEVKINLPQADSTVRVIAQQWAWTFVHPGPDNQLDTPDDISVVDELHVEMGKTYHFELTSRDVLHSFSVPVFRLKQDAIPGRIIKGWFNATHTGQFDIQCTEICGIGHGIMPARIVIESDSQHRLWNQANTPKLADAAPTTPPTSAGGMP
jgi:cytochrome c oxidase subunit II